MTWAPVSHKASVLTPFKKQLIVHLLPTNFDTFDAWVLSRAGSWKDGGSIVAADTDARGGWLGTVTAQIKSVPVKFS